MSRPIAAHKVFDFADVLAGWHKISVSAGPSGDLVVLSLRQEPEYRSRDGLTSKSFVRKPNDFRIHHLTEWSHSQVDLTPTLQNLHYAQPLPQGQWLAVRARSEGNTDGNGHIYSASGELTETLALGDGIADVQVTAQGEIWVGYFDEGIFGSSIFGSAGLACFDPHGALVFDFNSTTVLTGDSIADCYAFNAANSNETWLCPYTDFPIIKIKDKRISRTWSDNPIRGSDAFAVWKDRALFRGGYSEKDKLFIVSLYRQENNEMHKEECHAVDENGGRINFVGAFGRGSQLYLETEESIYSIELQEI